MTEKRSIKIEVPVLARVEGEGALELSIFDGEIKDLKLRIYEPPRYFEKFLEGRSYKDVPDTVARICGICPVAYQMSAVQAIEAVFACEPSAWALDMRRVMYCGEWLQSHSLHIHMLAAPDFLGFNSVIEMAAEHDDVVRRGIELQCLGNDLIALFGARSVHPVGVRTGGFHHVPPQDKVDKILARLEQALTKAEALVHWCASLELPNDDQYQQDFVSLALRNDDDYAITGGRLVSSTGLDIGLDAFEQHVEEFHVPHSTALHALLDGRPYLVGPLARLNLNADRLPDAVKAIMQECEKRYAIHFPSQNMFHSIVARAIEIYYVIYEARRLLSDYALPSQAWVEHEVKAGAGYGCTEAPRGLLWHRYELDAEGAVISARIVPPTSQNQARIEEDLRCSLQAFGLQNEDTALRLHGEKVIRNYDPCISCATHFLTMKIQRGSVGD